MEVDFALFYISVRMGMASECIRRKGGHIRMMAGGGVRFIFHFLDVWVGVRIL